MRFQKLLILFLVVSLSLSLAFSQTAFSVRKSSSKAYETPYQMRLEAQAEAADLRAKEADSRAAVARVSLEEFQRSGDRKDRKSFSKKQLDLKAEIALAESDAAQARAEAVRSRAEAVKEKASTASKLASDPVKDKKAQAKYYDALWLEQLAAKSEKDIAQAEGEAARKNKIATEAARKAEEADQELQRVEAKEAARQAKIAGKTKAETADAPKIYNVPTLSAADETKAQAREAARAEKEAARLAKAEQEAARKAQEIAAAEQAKADREIAKRMKAEQDAARKAQAKEAALQEEANRQAARAAKAEQEAAHKAQEIAAIEKAKADRERAEHEALQKALAEDAVSQKAEAERKAQKLAALEKAKADREAERRAKSEQEMLQKEQAREAALKEEAAKQEARRIKAEQENARRAEELAAAEKAKADREATRLAREEEKAKKLAAEKEAQAVAAQLAEKAKEARKAHELETARKAEEAQKAKAAEFFREKKTVVTAAAPTITAAPALASADSSADSLLEELLRKKQMEMDLQEASAPVNAAKSAPQPVKAADVSSRAAEPIKVLGDTSGKSERFFRANDAVSASSPAVVPAVASEPVRVAQSTTKQNQPAVQKTAAAAPLVAQQSETSDDLLEILRRKQAELDAQESSGRKIEPTPAPAPQPVKPAPAPKTTVEKATPPQPRVNVAKPQVVVSQPAVSPEAQDQLLEALRKKQAELDAKEGVTTAAPKVPAETTKVAPTDAEKEREKRIRQIEAEIKAKEEAFKKSAAQPKPVVPSTKQESTKATAETKKEAKTLSEKVPIVEPGSKEARLAELLRKYKADEITPHEYHFQRAKIIAEP